MARASLLGYGKGRKQKKAKGNPYLVDQGKRTNSARNRARKASKKEISCVPSASGSSLESDLRRGGCTMEFFDDVIGLVAADSDYAFCVGCDDSCSCDDYSCEWA